VSHERLPDFGWIFIGLFLVKNASSTLADTSTAKKWQIVQDFTSGEVSYERVDTSSTYDQY
jgi:hypothetical protein